MSHTTSNDLSSPNRDRFAVPVVCKKCGQHGSVFWEENAIHNRTEGSQRELISVSNGFHQEIGRTQSGDAVIVCDSCGEQLVD